MRPKDIGAEVKVLSAFSPVADDGAADIEGTTIDRLALNTDLPLSGVLHIKTGAASGTPTSFTVDVKIQDSADDTTWADFDDPDGNTYALDQITAIDTDGYLDLQLDGARQYVRAYAEIAFVGGTAPTILVAGSWVLGGNQVKAYA